MGFIVFKQERSAVLREILLLVNIMHDIDYEKGSTKIELYLSFPLVSLWGQQLEM